MLRQLRMAMLSRSLRRLAERTKRRRCPHTLETARAIGLLFDASEEETRRIVALWAEGFAEREPRKHLHTLAFIDDDHIVGQTRFPQFTFRDAQWHGRVQSPAIEHFLSEPLDLLLCYNPHQQLPIQWVALASKASMKVGDTPLETHDFDLVIETPPGKDVHFFLREVAFYLSKITPVSRHEQPA